MSRPIGISSSGRTLRSVVAKWNCSSSREKAVV